jgi:Polyketide cyclase / dehydrase and lipid transport
MTFRTESRIPIAGSVDDVWAYLADVGRWHEWAPTVLEARVADRAPLQPGARVEQRARGILGTSRRRAQNVTAVEAPHRMAFAGPLGTSKARWGMELEPLNGTQTDAMMWIEVDLEGVMRAIPGSLLESRIQRVSDLEMTLIKSAVESSTP